jgi:hypothetical protein
VVLVVRSQALLDVEGFAVRVGVDPDRRRQGVTLRALTRQGGQSLHEVLDPLETSGRLRQTKHLRGALHQVSLPT